MRSIPKISPCGDAALTVEFPQIVDAQINAQVLGLDAEIGRAALTGVIESAPTYASVLVYFDPLLTSFGRLRDQIYDLNTRTTPIDDTGDRWTIPVCYGGGHGFDLDDVSELHQLDPTEVANRHAAPDYRIYMIGFLPGFAYLGGLDPILFTPRRPTPRTKVPAGSIVIGGVQTAVGSIVGPSGWHVIGATPVRMFMARRDPVVFVKPGDRVNFEPITAKQYGAMYSAAERGEIVAVRSQ